MGRYIILGACITVLAIAETAQAQIVIQRPFGRVIFGGGAGIQIIGPRGNVIRLHPGMAPVVMPQAPSSAKPAAKPAEDEQEELPAPRPVSEKNAKSAKLVPVKNAPAKDAPPEPTAKTEGPAMSLKDFADKFQPKKGTFNLDIVSPVTKQPTPVRFTLPEGTPKRVQLLPDGIEFIYGPRRFVRIQFDNDGAFVTSR